MAISHIYGQQRGRAFVFCFFWSHFTSPLLLVTRPSPALVFHAKFCLSISLPLSLICLSVFLSRPRVPKGPLVCLTRLWLQDLCIQCVIIVPTLSSESLSDWLTDCSLRHTDPSVYYPDYSFICTSLAPIPLPFLFSCPSCRLNFFCCLLPLFHVLFSPLSHRLASRSCLSLPLCLSTTLGLSCSNFLQMPLCYQLTAEPRFGHPAVLTQKQ